MREQPADPFGEVVAPWSNLADVERDRHARRIVGVGVADARVDRPDAHCHRDYARLLDAALTDDPVALGWLAETHRPLLLTRGRLLFDHDPAEWGGASIEVLLRSAGSVHGGSGPWLRRQVAQQICHRMRRLVRRELARHRCERAVDPSQLPTLEPCDDPEPHPQLTIALERALDRLDDATSAGLRAVAMQLPLDTVAADHDLTHVALRQRVVRARQQLRPQLAGFARSA